jgi:ABC-2 type transport system ATP-binding protein
MRRSAAEGRTILFATHYLEEADEVADRVIVIDDGRIVADGSGRSLRSRVAGRTVRFDTTAADPIRLGTLPGVTQVDVHGDAVRLSTTDGDGTVRALFATDLPVRDLEVTGADLEDAFIALTSDQSNAEEAIR